MFGYVNVNQPELRLREYDRYRGFYCGLCRSMKENYGIHSRLSLSYDITFLVLLLTSLYEPETTARHFRCPIHPVGKRLMLQNRFSDYGADMNLLCAWYLTEDKLLDADSVKDKVTGNGLSVLYRQAFKKLKLKYPGKTKRIEAWLKELHQLEADGCDDLDRMAGLSGRITAELFAPRQDEWTAELKAIGFHLGKFIYLMDAWEDIEKDLRSGAYNPLLSIYNREKEAASQYNKEKDTVSPYTKEKDTISRQDDPAFMEGFDNICRQYMTIVMGECAAHFERLPLIEDVEILRNILYSGIWTRFELIRQKRSIDAV